MSREHVAGMTASLERAPSWSWLPRAGPARVSPRRLRLGLQLFLGMFVIAITVAVAAGLIVNTVERRYLMAATELEKEKFFDLLISSSLEDLISEDVPHIETTMTLLTRGDKGLFSAEITNEAGQTLYSWQRQAAAQSVVSGSHEALAPSEPPAPLHTLSFSRQVRFEDMPFGRVSIVWDVTVAYQEITAHAYMIALLVGGVCLVMSLLVCLLSASLAIRPINRIAKQVTHFRGGHYHDRWPLPVFASQELADLHGSVQLLGEFLVQRNAREAELKEAKEMAEAANRAKSSFLANMSHELRTPLNAINGFSEIMHMEVFGPLGDARYKEYAEQINVSGGHLLGVISDILDLSKVEAGKEELDLEALDLVEVVRSAVSLVEERAKQADLRFSIEIAADMPKITADPRRLRQVLLNLLSNAVKFTPAGGRVEVTACWDAREGITVTVADTGLGMDEKQIQTALEAFGQVDSSYARRFEGTGLGLPLARALTELHGGSLDIRSEPGKGTDVIITLPPDLAIKPGAGTQIVAA